MGQSHIKSAEKKALDEAKNYIEKKDYYDAIITLAPHTVSNNIEVILLLCKIYIAACDYKSAISYLQQGVSLNDPECMYLLGDIYYYGRMTCVRDSGYIIHDYQNAFRLFNEATELKYEKAKCMLAKCHRKGKGTVPNKEKAFDLYQIGKKNNCPECIYQLGKIKFIENKTKGVQLLERATFSNNEKACYFLGKIYLENNRQTIGMNYLLQASQKNHIKACKLLGEQYKKMKYYNDAIKFFIKADHINELIDINNYCKDEIAIQSYDNLINHLINSCSNSHCPKNIDKILVRELENRKIIQELTNLNITPIFPSEPNKNFTDHNSVIQYHKKRIDEINQHLKAQRDASPDNPNAPTYLEARQDWNSRIQ